MFRAFFVCGLAKAEEIERIENSGGHVSTDYYEYVNLNLKHYANEVDLLLHRRCAEMLTEIPGITLPPSSPLFPRA
jgi:hypothetical protein